MRRPQIESWTTDNEARELARLAAGKEVLEVGTYRGFGAVLMAKAGATCVWAVDWHRGDADLGDLDTLCSWWTNIRRHQVEDRVVGLVGRTFDVLPKLAPESFDMAFIDAYHEYEAVRLDIAYTLPLLRAGGVLACHDFSATWPGVVQAVNEFAARWLAAGRLADVQVTDSLAVLTLRGSGEPFPLAAV